EVLTLRGHTMMVFTAAFSPDGQRLATGGDDSTVKIWELTPLTAELRLEREAAALVNRLAAEPLPKAEVIERIQGGAGRRPAVRQRALPMVDRYEESPYEFAGAALSVVRNPGAEPSKYRLALRQAEAACRLTPPRAENYRLYLSTLGKAQY